ncbi:MAG: hypothetical protein LHW45_11180 [Candidatus Cloacimonetes bacterium]|nr:hypothetical protein [Candidatus Cloacimonadota bacterium]MDY0368170.1 hypothetical protein [Candidatus Syntrophosphaera sp.]
MTDEIMPREDRSGKVWAFLGGCIAGIAGLFAVALISDMPSSTASSSDSSENDTAEQEELLSPKEEGGSVSGN